MRAYGKTHVGRIRTINEDAFYVPESNETTVVIADGMGGHLAGEVASAMAIRNFVEFVGEHTINEQTLHHAVMTVNKAIYRESQLDPLKHGMGTTLTALCIVDTTAYLTHVGDSRAYLLRNKALMQLTNDHSLVNELVEKGELTPTEAKNHPQRNYITRALGTNKNVEPDIIRLDYRKGDVWLLCSDGLSNYMQSTDIAKILMKKTSWENKLDALINFALEKGGGDNITALILTGEDGDVK